MAVSLPPTAAGQEQAKPKAAPAEIVNAAVANGSVAFKLTTLEEVQELIGTRGKESNDRDGDMEVRVLEYADVRAVFARPAHGKTPIVLYQLSVSNRLVDIGEARQLVLRSEQDLPKLDTFWGLADVSAIRLDLRPHLNLLQTLPFDSLTRWPPEEKLPAGFEPAKMLEAGKNPGLGVRKLHAEAIDGTGIGIAIIDQPLLRDHSEYKAALAEYHALEVDGVEPQMHGPPVCSIAVGKTCGIAPRATLYYYATPAWKWLTDEPWTKTLDQIVAHNKDLKTPKVRVVSISLGAFSERRGFAEWQSAVQRANAAGILVVTCDPKFLRIGTLKRSLKTDGEAAADYERGRYFAPQPDICAPAGNRSIASHRGPEVFTFDRTGGMSWSVPYLAGVAALGFQVNPELSPEKVLNIWRETATRTAVGPVINPAAFVNAAQACRKTSGGRTDAPGSALPK